MSAAGLGEMLEDLARDRTTERGLFTTTVNFVTFCSDDPGCETVARHAREIGEKHSCRAILLNASRGEDLRSVERERSEHVEVGVKGLDAATIRSIARTLCVPNVRTSLFWSSRQTFSDDRFGALASDAQTVIVDSSRLEESAKPIRELAQVVAASPQMPLRDLAYMRLLPWQDMVAQFFDDPSLAEDLASVRSVDVCAGSDSETYYVLGWLASRLGWQPLALDTFTARDARSIAVRRERRGKARRIRWIGLETEAARYRAELTDDLDLACLSVEGKGARPKRCAPLHDVAATMLIERAMFLAGNDPVFFESLAMAAALLAWA